MVIVIVLGIFSSLSTTFSQVATQLPSTTRVHLDINETNGYVTSLIDDYNVWVNQLEKPKPDWNSIKAYFSLYHEAGNSFRVIVVQMDLYNTQVGLIFIRIQADQPEVSVEYNFTFRTLFPNMGEVVADTYTETNLPFRYNGTMVLEDFLLEIDSKDISPAYAQNAYDTAKYIYQQDHNNAPPIPTVSQTQTFKTSQTEVTTIQSSIQDPFALLNDNPYIKLIVNIFGSLVTFALFVGGLIVVVVKHKKLTSVLKGLVDVDSQGRYDKSEEEKKEQ